MKKHFIILYTEAGGGHKSAAKALRTILEQNPEWQVTLLNPLQEICPEFDLIKKITGIPTETVYNKFVAAREHSFFSLLLISGVLIFNMFWYRKQILQKLQLYWKSCHADMIISVMPFINDLMCESINAVAPQIPFVTIPTDYSECAKNIWINGKEQYMICGTHKLVEQALKAKNSQDHIFQISGMITRPAFYQVYVTNKQQRLQEIGLQIDVPTGVVMFGSHASDSMLKIAKTLCNAPFKLQLIFICGHDTILQQQLENLQLDYSVLVLGYVNNVQDYMALADFFIGKPGGASVTEAAIMHLPIILLAGPFTLLQERYNAHWVEENGLGIRVNNFNNITAVIQKVLNSKQQYQDAYKKINNKGIFEIPTLLESIIDQHCSKIEQKSIPQAITSK